MSIKTIIFLIVSFSSRAKLFAMPGVLVGPTSGNIERVERDENLSRSFAIEGMTIGVETSEPLLKSWTWFNDFQFVFGQTQVIRKSISTSLHYDLLGDQLSEVYEEADLKVKTSRDFVLSAGGGASVADWTFRSSQNSFDDTEGLVLTIDFGLRAYFAVTKNFALSGVVTISPMNFSLGQENLVISSTSILLGVGLINGLDL